MTVRLEGRAQEHSSTVRPFEYTLYGNARNNEIHFKRGKRQRGDELKNINFKKWQFIG